MKAILSQGQGKLLLHQTAALLKKRGVEVKYITGWLPKGNPWFVNLVGKVVGKRDLYLKLKLRQPESLADSDVITCTFPELYFWGLLTLAKLKVLPHDTALYWGWKFWGRYSKRHIKNAEIFHVRSGAGQGGAIAKAKAKNMKVVVDHSIAHPVAMKKFLIDEYNRFNQKYDLDPETKFWTMVMKDCSDADYIVVNSDFVKDTFIENGYHPDKLKVSYLGVRNDFIGLKKNWEITPNQPVHLLFIGAFGFRKGARIMIEAMKIFADKKANIVLDVVGNIDDMGEMLKAYNLTNINFHGTFVYDELIRFLQSKDIFIFPTFAEGSARAAMEAMGAGLPVITTSNCGVPVTHDETGLIIPVNDTMALVQAIERLAADTALRKKLGQNASTLIEDKYSWDIYTNDMIAFYKTIIG